MRATSAKTRAACLITGAAAVLAGTAAPALATSPPPLTSLVLFTRLPAGYGVRASVATVRTPYLDDTTCKKIQLAPRHSSAVFSRVVGPDQGSLVFGNETLVRTASAAQARSTYRTFLAAVRACGTYNDEGVKTTVKVTGGPVGGRDSSAVITQVGGGGTARQAVVLQGHYLFTVNGYETKGSHQDGLTYATTTKLTKAAVTALHGNR